MKRRAAWMLIILSLGGCGGGAAGKSSTEAGKEAAGKSSSSPAGTARIAGLPADFPADVPLYPGMALLIPPTSVLGSHIVNCYSSDPIDKVYAFYEERLGKDGWSILNRFSGGGSKVLTAAKEDKGCNVALTADGAKTTVSLTVGRDIKGKTDGGDPPDPMKPDPIEPKTKPAAGVPLDKGFPTDVALYPGATVTRSLTVTAIHTTELTTPDAVPKVLAFFESSLKKQGWTVVTSAENGKEGGMVVDKPDRILTIALRREADATQVTIIVAPK